MKSYEIARKLVLDALDQLEIGREKPVWETIDFIYKDIKYALIPGNGLNAHLFSYDQILTLSTKPVPIAVIDLTDPNYMINIRKALEELSDD